MIEVFVMRIKTRIMKTFFYMATQTRDWQFRSAKKFTGQIVAMSCVMPMYLSQRDYLGVARKFFLI